MQRLMAGNQVPDIFANQLRMSATLTDFAITFGTAEGGHPGPTFVADKAIIHVAPGMLKQILFHIQIAVDAYEEAIGEIPIPKNLQKFLEKTKKALASQLKHQMEGPFSEEPMPGAKG